MDSEDLSLVEVGGLSNLKAGNPAALKSYLPDPKGFAAFGQTTAFKEYVDYIIKPSYTMHQNMGILRTTITGEQLESDMSFRNFFSGRVLWDEAMATSSARWLLSQTLKGNDPLLVGLVGNDHVKFGCGVPARCARLLAAAAGGGAGLSDTEGVGNGSSGSGAGGGSQAVVSVMLNPSPLDTRGDQSPGGFDRDGRRQQDFLASTVVPRGANGRVGFRDMTLQLRFAAVDGDGERPIQNGSPEDPLRAFEVCQTRRKDDAVLPVADFLLFSGVGEQAVSALNV